MQLSTIFDIIFYFYQQFSYNFDAARKRAVLRLCSYESRALLAYLEITIEVVKRYVVLI